MHDQNEVMAAVETVKIVSTEPKPCTITSAGMWIVEARFNSEADATAFINAMLGRLPNDGD